MKPEEIRKQLTTEDMLDNLAQGKDNFNHRSTDLDIPDLPDCLKRKKPA